MFELVRKRAPLMSRGAVALALMLLLAPSACKERMERAEREFAALPPEYAGKLVYGRVCVNCHTLTGKRGGDAPDLLDVPKRRDAEWIRAYLRDPRSMLPNSRMPRFALSETEIDRVSAFLAGLPDSIHAAAPAKRP